MADEPEEKRAEAPTSEEILPGGRGPSERGSRYRVSSIVVRSIPTLLEALREELQRPELWVFRGQGDWEWALRPKRGRRGSPEEKFPLKPTAPPALAQTFAETLWWLQDRQVFDDWKAEAVALVPPSLPRPSSSVEWLAIGQHHGLHTRLLDWTRNPLVGAYFAVREPSREKDSALFALRGLPELELQCESDPWRARGIRLWHPPSLVERIGRQSGLFTLHQLGDRGGSLDLVSYAEGLWYDDGSETNPFFSLSNLALVKIRIESSARTVLRDELKLLGVDEFFAFPDLEGLCRAYQEGRFRRPTFGHLLLDKSK
jgi:hypothetical protein